MPTDLVVFGPYELPCDGDGVQKRFDPKEHGKHFWENPELQIIKKKHGCYVFALKAGPGYTPWYVGKTHAGFKDEIFQHHKVVNYNEVLWSKAKGTPVMFFVTKPGTKNVVSEPVLSEIEKELTIYAYRKNNDLKNFHNTKGGPQWSIKGVINSGRGKTPKTAGTFKSMMGI